MDSDPRGLPAIGCWTESWRSSTGEADGVAEDIRQQADRARLDAPKRRAAEQAADYLAHTAPYLDYPAALAHGWPIATGVIEGACRRLVKDRMDVTGARWGLLAQRPS